VSFPTLSRQRSETAPNYSPWAAGTPRRRGRRAIREPSCRHPLSSAGADGPGVVITPGLQDGHRPVQAVKAPARLRERQRLGPWRLSHPVMVRGEAPVMAAAPAMSRRPARETPIAARQAAADQQPASSGWTHAALQALQAQTPLSPPYSRSCRTMLRYDRLGPDAISSCWGDHGTIVV
jgi:hypothetical protein